jgi:hypothetical protein
MPEHKPAAPSAVDRAEAIVESLSTRVADWTTVARSDKPDKPDTQAGHDARQKDQAHAANGPDPSDAMNRADEIVTRVAQRTGYLAAIAARAFRRGVALAREELEDIYAEAQDLRHAEHEDGAPKTKPAARKKPSTAKTSGGSEHASE